MESMCRGLLYIRLHIPDRTLGNFQSRHSKRHIVRRPPRDAAAVTFNRLMIFYGLTVSPDDQGLPQVGTVAQDDFEAVLIDLGHIADRNHRPHRKREKQR